MSSYLMRLRELSKNKKNVQSNVAFIKAMDYIENLEIQLNVAQTLQDVQEIGSAGPILFVQDEIFLDCDEHKWQITVTTDSFVIATRCGVDRDYMTESDIMKLEKPITASKSNETGWMK